MKEIIFHYGYCSSCDSMKNNVRLELSLYDHRKYVRQLVITTYIVMDVQMQGTMNNGKLREVYLLECVRWK